MKKNIFISIPRTGTNSVRRVLGLEKRDSHRSAKWLMENRKDEWQDSFVFAFVRNPFDRLVSWFEYHKNPDNVPEGVTLYGGTFEEWVLNGCKHHFTNNDAMGLGGETANPLKLCDYLCVNGELEADWLGRMECFYSDVLVLCRELEAPIPHTIPRLNSTIRQAYRTYYTPEMVELVNRRFAGDLTRFNYEF